MLGFHHYALEGESGGEESLHRMESQRFEAPGSSNVAKKNRTNAVRPQNCEGLASEGLNSRIENAGIRNGGEVGRMRTRVPEGVQVGWMHADQCRGRAGMPMVVDSRS